MYLEKGEGCIKQKLADFLGEGYVDKII